MKPVRARSHVFAATRHTHTLRRLAGLVLFSAGWLLWMHDMASWALTS
jgi:hypothetical protein